MIYVGIAAFLVAVGTTWAFTPAVIRLAGVLGAMDRPGGRKTHVEPTPRIGGLAVFCGFAAGMAFAAFATGNLFSTPQAGVYWRGLGFAATGLLIVGLLDDLFGLSYRWKFAAQIVAAVYVWHCGFRIEIVTHPLGGGLELGLFSFPVTLLWIVGITNAVNLIDGLDGLAAGIALITTLAVAIFAFISGHLGVTAASVTLAGSLIGFLRYNFNPARIFLGDSGSLFLGFVLAVTSVRGSQKGPTAIAILIPLLILGLPLLDTGLAVLRRLHRLGNHGARTDNAVAYILRNLNQIFLPDREHIHHRLMDRGLSHRGAVLVLYGVGVLFALAAFALALSKNVWLALALGGLLLALMALFLGLLYLRERRGGSPAGRVSGVDPGAPPPDGALASPAGRVRGR